MLFSHFLSFKPFILKIVINLNKPFLIFLFLTVLSYIFLNRLQKRVNIHFSKNELEPKIKEIENKFEKRNKNYKIKYKTAYHFFVKDEWPKLKKEFVNYNYKELLQYLSLRWNILKDKSLRKNFLEETQRMNKYKKLANNKN